MAKFRGHRVWAMASIAQVNDVEQVRYWCGRRDWTSNASSRKIRRYVTEDEARREYDYHFRAYGYVKPPAAPLNVGRAPDDLCVCGKDVIGHTPYEAASKLVTLWQYAHSRRTRAVTRRRENRYYECPRTPGNYHLTSRETP